MSDRLKETGRQIRTYRLALGMSLQEFAARIHKSKATVSKYENGLISIDPETFFDISDVLGIAPAKLMVPPDTGGGEDAAPGSLQSRMYLYSYARRGRLTKSVLDHYACTDIRGSNKTGAAAVTFFYDVPSFENLENAAASMRGPCPKKGLY